LKKVENFKQTSTSGASGEGVSMFNPPRHFLKIPGLMPKESGGTVSQTARNRSNSDQQEELKTEEPPTISHSQSNTEISPPKQKVKPKSGFEGLQMQIKKQALNIEMKQSHS
jgi:hypothetical protein